MTEISSKLHKVLALIHQSLLETGSGPTTSELAKKSSYSRGDVVNCVVKLEARGLISRNGLTGRSSFERLRLTPRGEEILGIRTPKSPQPAEPEKPAKSSKKPSKGPFDDLIEAAKKKPGLVELCNKLDLSPSKLEQLIQSATERGYAIQVTGGYVGLGVPDSDEIKESGIEPTVGSRFRIGVMGDLHLGSKYCLRPEIRDCVRRIYRSGARDILIPGDLLDGCYRHGEFELRYSGIHDQTMDLLNTLPEMEGLRYHAITGNHDFTFTEKTGVDVGRYITGVFRDSGRSDLLFYGDRAETLNIGGTSVRMLHPSGSCSYAISYKLQKFVESFDSGEKPGILLVGHYHKSCYIYTRGVHTLACPTLQGPGSAFGKSLGAGPQAIGGLVLSWKLTKHKTIREFTLKPISYFKTEQSKEVQSLM